jgi:hypothetical protein
VRLQKLIAKQFFMLIRANFDGQSRSPAASHAALSGTNGTSGYRSGKIIATDRATVLTPADAFLKRCGPYSAFSFHHLPFLFGRVYDQTEQTSVQVNTQTEEDARFHAPAAACRDEL